MSSVGAYEFLLPLVVDAAQITADAVFVSS